MRACTCGHPKDAHLHYRRGTDCAHCLCPKFHVALIRRRARPPLPAWIRTVTVGYLPRRSVPSVDARSELGTGGRRDKTA